ncbi:DNA recombination protein RmuC [Salinivirga cyanobacteriivorans]|uniref:DNA recombination protein RmuC n=1 Tax=Salinivirga cyanobacteriivorans TaxID=1307839 RepID=A0A0S2I1L8_9BACT|nr:DNA recombination protein RmuC [Salinivirga cyanobacteriivorans]ALO15916.1 DNA recombination protein RmuC [Salinivirga cyanobacteriivorans]
MDQFTTVLLFVLFAGAVGAIIVFWQKLRYFKEQKYKTDLQVSELGTQTEYYRNRNYELQEQLSKLQDDFTTISTEKARLQESLKHTNAQMQQKEKDFVQMQHTLKTEFKNLSHDLFTQSTEALNKTNKTSIDQIVQPLKEKLQQYNQLLTDFREKDVKERSTLSAELKQLQELNKQLSHDAQNLAGALKNDSKIQGNWGEMVLERILEKAGLEKNITYKTQVSTVTEAGRVRPDVVVFLPENRHLIIDSKVSLSAFERLVNAEDDTSRERALNEHLTSVKNHITNLAQKSYETGETLNSPEFIFLFMPVENALSLALQYDSTLQDLAWKNRIVLVTPATLMATLMTVANLWKIEKQNEFAQRVADETGKLYDKFVGLLESVNDVGQKIHGAQRSHEQLIKQLSEGRGDLISRAEKIRKMGISHKKSLPSNFNEQE